MYSENRKLEDRYRKWDVASWFAARESREQPEAGRGELVWKLEVGIEGEMSQRGEGGGRPSHRWDICEISENAVLPSPR